MHDDGHISRIVREWLRADEDTSADQLLEDVLAMVAMTPAPTVPAIGRRDGRRLDGYIRLLVAATVVLVVAVVGMDVLPPGAGITGGPGPSPSVRPTASPDPDPGVREVVIPWSNGQVHLAIPAGWSSIEAGTAVSKGGRYVTGNPPSVSVHRVTRVVTDACPGGDIPIEDRPFSEIGPTVEDLTKALVNIKSLEISGPVAIIVGGYPAKRYVVTEPDWFSSRCGGPEGRSIWQDGNGSTFGVLNGGRATVYIIDVDGDRLVIATHQRGASAEDVAQLDAVVGSIDIEAGPRPLEVGRHSLTVDGVSFSFNVSTRTEGGWADFNGVSINKSMRGPQTAEGIIYWTGFPDGAHTELCGRLATLPAGSSSADLAQAVAAFPGIGLIAGPSDVTVGGRPARHVALTVTEDLGCDPGFFVSWHVTTGGPFWVGTSVGDMVDVWVVDVDGKRLLIASEIHQKTDLGGTDLPAAIRIALRQEIQQIVDSITFD